MGVHHCCWQPQKTGYPLGPIINPMCWKIETPPHCAAIFLTSSSSMCVKTISSLIHPLSIDHRVIIETVKLSKHSGLKSRKKWGIVGSHTFVLFLHFFVWWMLDYNLLCYFFPLFKKQKTPIMISSKFFRKPHNH